MVTAVEAAAKHNTQSHAMPLHRDKRQVPSFCEYGRVSKPTPYTDFQHVYVCTNVLRPQRFHHNYRLQHPFHRSQENALGAETPADSRLPTGQT